MDYLNIALLSNEQKFVRLKDFAGEKLVLYFYPKDNTPGCTLEAKDFTRLKHEFGGKGYRIVGVSKDSVQSHIAFCKSQDLDLLLLSDPDLLLAKAFDVLQEKILLGKKTIGISRSTFLLDETGKITKEYRGIKAEGHAIKILDEI
jgi:peroxiredoxin Q/BCP